MKIDCGSTTQDSVKLGDTFLNGTIALAQVLKLWSRWS